MEVEKYEILQSTFKLLRFNGLWRKSTKMLETKKYQLQVLLLSVIYNVNAIGCVFHFVHTLASGPPYIFADLIEDVAVISASIGFYFMTFIFTQKSVDISKLIIHLADYSKFGKPPSVDRMNRLANKMIIIFYVYAWCSWFTYVGMKYLNRPRCREAGIQHGVPDRSCSFPMPVWMPVDVTRFPSYHIYSLVQLVATGANASNISLFTTFTVGVVEMTICRIKHFKGIMAQTFGIEDREARKKHLKYCIKYHISIINLCDRINGIFNKICLMHITFDSIAISLVGFQFLVEPSLVCVAHGMAWVLMLGMSCGAGQRLIDETSTITLSIYKTEWYIDDAEMQKHVNFMMMRGNKQMGLDTGGFGILSMERFGAVIQSAYSYLTMMSQTLRN